MRPLTKFLAAILCGIFAPLFAAESLPLGISTSQPSSGPYVKVPQGYMVSYRAKIPRTEVTFQMVPVPGGKFKLSSPAEEVGRKKDEGTQVEVEVPPFWIATHEVTWNEYRPYMAMHELFRKIDKDNLLPITDANRIDVVTAPSLLYDPTFTYQSGDEGERPAISMSQFAARQYSKWLSGITGEFYRLPTEAEWEYACRAGTNTAYSLGDDAAMLGDYAWFTKNSNEATQLVGKKKPNAWGLYDMHGNAAEWVIDAYDAAGYPHLADKTQPVKADAAINWPTKLFPRAVRGGSWDDAPENLRSAARHPSDDNAWRITDPCFPQSPWWFTDAYALGVGFRLVRPLEVPERDAREKFWKADVPQVQKDADTRIDQDGRGKRSLASPELLKVLEGLK